MCTNVGNFTKRFVLKMHLKVIRSFGWGYLILEAVDDDSVLQAHEEIVHLLLLLGYLVLGENQFELGALIDVARELQNGA